ncbi:MAG TPA: hypothetical protein VEJ17_00710 [Candidatus Nitrosotalea sp.]|nr:hypothetical protein [Candidatus Nitrosotalea sp.]
MIQRPTFLRAFGASFAVYLIPVVGPHAFWPLGEYLYEWVRTGAPDRAVSWIAMEWGLAIALQVVAGALWYWFFARPRWLRLLPLAASAPIFFFLAQWAYLLALPSLFLIEQDKGSESGDWNTVCALVDMSLAQVQSPPDVPLERAGQAWLTVTGTNAYAVLTMPGCQTHSVELPFAYASIMRLFVLPGGGYLLGVWDNKTAQTHWWLRDGSLRPLPRPPAYTIGVAPILSNDGKWAAWLETIPAAGVTPPHQRVVIRSLDDDRERLVNLPPPRGSLFLLLGVDMAGQELTFYEHAANQRSSLTMLGLDGERREQAFVAEGVDPQSTTFLRAGSGWVAWDAAREPEEPYRVAWSLPGGRGTHRVLKGRGITAVAVDPSGAYLAISTTTSLNIGHIKDAVYVLRTSDGKEVWRRYLPAYARASLAFLGDKLFAYTDWDGVHATVRVLQIPD